MEGLAQVGSRGGGGSGGRFDEGREGVGVGWASVGEHVGEEEEGGAGLAEVKVGSDQGIEEEGGVPFEMI